MSSYNDDGISYLKGIVSAGDLNHTAAVQISHKEILFQVELRKGFAKNRAAVLDGKFQSFCTVIRMW